jgi:Domain of unknown function (DUF4160)
LRVHDEWTHVPRVSAFHGIVIRMFFNEDIHSGRPHFHAEHAGTKATYDIRTLEPIAGRLHPRAGRMVVEWGRAHRFELRRNWELMRVKQPPSPIEPLR